MILKLEDKEIARAWCIQNLFILKQIKIEAIILTQEWLIFLKALSNIAQLWHQCLSYVSHKHIEEASWYIDNLKDIVKLIWISKHIKIKKSLTAQKSNLLKSEY